MCVDETGVEHPPDVFDALGGYILDEDDNELYTPNYVSGPTPEPGGLRVYVDCKGSIDPRMAATFHRILREELESLAPDVSVVSGLPFDD
jgi:hypothetical protein